VDFRNTVLIMTSNLGTEFVTRPARWASCARTARPRKPPGHQKIEKALKDTFRPEFLNRIDEIIIFSPLSLEQMESIVDLQMKEIHARLSEHNLSVELTEAACKWLARQGYDPAFGARPLRRALQRTSRARSLRWNGKTGEALFCHTPCPAHFYPCGCLKRLVFGEVGLECYL
jgi:ATP-dependent Clp protease ATP-binding subunit ClpC